MGKRREPPGERMGEPRVGDGERIGDRVGDGDAFAGVPVSAAAGDARAPGRP